ncbi:MAG TPA: hypothetical protein VNA89_11635, partial [Gemmatimonadaceae bacterium]|nr:hypothetical protein [Gemmatimonadaceae bacterium]
ADGTVDRANSEVIVEDSSQFVGSSAPTRLATLNTGLEFLGRQFRFSTLLDYKGGHRLYNNTERIRCQSRRNCRGLNDATAPLWQQARVVALLNATNRQSFAGFFEEADFIRLRELSLTFTPGGDAVTRLFRARSANITLAARNLAVWTKYSGIDPELDISAADGSEVPNEFQTLGPSTYWTLRVNLGF